MPVRIYSLAKELKVDSKELVAICNKLGITGKGSALASLDDDEVARVQSHLSESAPAPAEQKATDGDKEQKPLRAVRQDTALAGRGIKPRVIPTPKKQAAPAESPAQKSRSPLAGISEKQPPAPPEPEQPAAPELPEEPQKAAAEAAPSEPKQPPKPAEREPSGPPLRPAAAGAQRREGAAQAGSKIRSLDTPRARSGEGDGGPRTRKRREPVINLAALPEVSSKTPKPAKGEGPTQKPEIKLSKDVIAGTKQGMKAPLQQLVQEQDDRKQGKPRGPGLSGFTAEEQRGRKGRQPATAETGGDEKERKGLAGMASARADRGKGKKRADRGRTEIERALQRVDDDRRRRKTLSRKGTNTAAPRKEKVVVELPCTIRTLSEAAGIPAAAVLKVLMQMGTMANINASLDPEVAESIAVELGLDVEFRHHETLEDELIMQLEEQEDPAEKLIARPPVVTFLGHVDHGKTSLLDYLIGINVAAGEAGGITQHIRAYEIDKDGRKVCFVDTPGHAAFTEMRARGANVTDIAVLVIAADDGVMPQTEEAISHAKAAEVPIVVALNKCDLEGADVNRVMTQLTEYNLTPSEWGGDVEVVRTSAITGQGMDELLDTLLTVAELNEYRANPDRAALGVCLESEQQGDRGVIAKLIVQNGTLRTGDIIVCGPAYGRVRAMQDPLTGQMIESAGPSTPIGVIGLNAAPGAGDRFHVLDSISAAREIAEARELTSRADSLSGQTTRVSFESFQEMLEGGRLGKTQDRARLNLIVRADVRGSLEAIEKELIKFDHPEVEVRILQKSVGGITVADVTLASASDAIIIGFNVIPDDAARSLADERGVELRRYSVIYQLADDMKALIEGRLKPEERVVELGRAVVKAVFSISRVGAIAGCYVVQGTIERGCRIRVNREGRTIGDYPLDSLRRHKDDVKEVPRGMECGIKLSGFNNIKQDDMLEAYRIEEVARKLD